MTESAPDALVIIDSPDFTHRVARRVRAKTRRSPSSTTSRPRSGPGGRAGRARCSAMSITCWVCCRSSRRNTASSRAAMQLCRPSPDRAIAVAAPERRGQAPRQRAAGAAGAARQPPQRDPASSRESLVRRSVACRQGGSRSSWCCRPCRISKPPSARACKLAGQAADRDRRNREACRVPDRARGAGESGTVTLELALSGIPMVTAYRVGAIEAFILRRAIQVHSVILANLVIGKDVIPEFLQEDCTPEKLAPALADILPIRRHAGGRSTPSPGSTPSCRPATPRPARSPPTSRSRRCARAGGRRREPQD